MHKMCHDQESLTKFTEVGREEGGGGGGGETAKKRPKMSPQNLFGGVRSLILHSFCVSTSATIEGEE